MCWYAATGIFFVRENKIAWITYLQSWLCTHSLQENLLAERLALTLCMAHGCSADLSAWRMWQRWDGCLTVDLVRLKVQSVPWTDSPECKQKKSLQKTNWLIDTQKKMFFISSVITEKFCLNSFAHTKWVDDVSEGHEGLVDVDSFLEPLSVVVWRGVRSLPGTSRYYQTMDKRTTPWNKLHFSEKLKTRKMYTWFSFMLLMPC